MASHLCTTNFGNDKQQIGPDKEHTFRDLPNCFDDGDKSLGIKSRDPFN